MSVRITIEKLTLYIVTTVTINIFGWYAYALFFYKSVAKQQFFICACNYFHFRCAPRAVLLLLDSIRSAPYEDSDN